MTKRRIVMVKRWSRGVPIGEIWVMNRVNTDTLPGLPSLESILVGVPMRGCAGGQPVNFQATKPSPVPAAATQTVAPVVQAAPRVTFSPAEQEQKVRREREEIKNKKHQKNMLKRITGEPITEESDSEPEDRKMTKEDIEQAMVEAFAIIANTDPARLGGATGAEVAHSQTRQQHGQENNLSTETEATIHKTTVITEPIPLVGIRNSSDEAGGEKKRN